MLTRLMNGLCAALLLCSVANALEIGDKAPQLKIANWVKGKEIVSFEKGHVYVVEFWATWCGPCRTSIPHLSKLQKLYDGKVTFIGISSEALDTVSSFVKKQGKGMGYTVAVDKDGSCNNAYNRPFDIGTIPHAYIVDQAGNLVHHCNPMQIDSSLAQVVAGTFDAKKNARVKALISDYLQKVAAGQDPVALRPLGEELLKLCTNPGILNEFAWKALTDKNLPKRDYNMLTKIAAAAFGYSGQKDPAIADTLARAQFDRGQQNKAIKTQRKAVELATDKRLKDELQATLDSYLAQVEKNDSQKQEIQPLDEATELELRGLFQGYFSGLMADKSLTELRPLGEKVMKICKDHPQILNQFAWNALTNEALPKRDYKLLTKMAKAAFDATEQKNAAIADTYARALFDGGQQTAAIEIQRKAVSLAVDAKMKAELEEALQQFLKQVKDSKKIKL